jgi:hypothetical protein
MKMPLFFLYSEVETGTGVMPWLIEEVAQEMKTMITSRHVISGQLFY